MTSSISSAIKAQAAAFGFASVGICDARAVPENATRLQTFLAAGHHGDMAWMHNRSDERADPQQLWPEVKSIIVLGMSYAPQDDPLRHHDNADIGVISVYAQGKDYHDVVKARLKQMGRWLIDAYGGDIKVFVDTAPVMEKPLGQNAGLGWQGKHTNLVSRGHGSWLFLGTIYTSLDLESDLPHKNNCGSCAACQDICPTKAFPAPYKLDARRCISYLTIEYKGVIPPEFRAAIGNRIYGCDDCLAVCPWNKFAAASQEIAFAPRAELTAPRLLELVELDDTAFRALFSGSPIKRIKRDAFVRNVVVALGNVPVSAAEIDCVIAAIERRLADSSGLVRAQAVAALRRLAPARAAALKADLLSRELAPEVLAVWAEATSPQG
jgi:epoxyqueuosine reductase